MQNDSRSHSALVEQRGAQVPPNQPAMQTCFEGQSLSVEQPLPLKSKLHADSTRVAIAAPHTFRLRGVVASETSCVRNDMALPKARAGPRTRVASVWCRSGSWPGIAAVKRFTFIIVPAWSVKGSAHSRAALHTTRVAGARIQISAEGDVGSARHAQPHKVGRRQSSVAL